VVSFLLIIALKNIDLFQIEHDYSFFTPDHSPSRSLPISDFDLREKIIASPLRPPYWGTERVLCFAPVSSLPIWKWEDEQKKQSIGLFSEDDFEAMQDEDGWFDD